ncbi:unnamed protein product [Thelazia callipaeda]|uniref:Ovule protein n=1 Tax=Thelazia callipaeda TaxID=103827 RepID=A0A0N5CUJ9_THECL|nr:unnamed protein product [Thelazia callipaeda]
MEESSWSITMDTTITAEINSNTEDSNSSLLQELFCEACSALYSDILNAMNDQSLDSAAFLSGSLVFLINVYGIGRSTYCISEVVLTLRYLNTAFCFVLKSHLALQ